MSFLTAARSRIMLRKRFALIIPHLDRIKIKYGVLISIFTNLIFNKFLLVFEFTRNVIIIGSGILVLLVF